MIFFGSANLVQCSIQKIVYHINRVEDYDFLLLKLPKSFDSSIHFPQEHNPSNIQEKLMRYDSSCPLSHSAISTGRLRAQSFPLLSCRGRTLNQITTKNRTNLGASKYCNILN